MGMADLIAEKFLSLNLFKGQRENDCGWTFCMQNLGQIQTGIQDNGKQKAE